MFVMKVVEETFSNFSKRPGRSKAVVLLLLIYCFMYHTLIVGVLCWSLVCIALCAF